MPGPPLCLRNRSVREVARKPTVKSRSMKRVVWGRWGWIFGCGAALAAVASLYHGSLPAWPGAGADAPIPPTPTGTDLPHSARPPRNASWVLFHDVTHQTGITFRHTDGSSGRHYIAETVSSGLASFDYDGDGWIDIYFPNGAPLPGTNADKPPRHALYRNLGGWRFQDVSQQAGVAGTGYGLGATVGDYNNDGWPDLYVSQFGPKVLYRNNGDGTFTDVTKGAGVADGDRLGAGVCFLDIDGDGNLDLYVANYVKFTFTTHVPWSHGTYPEYAGPKVYPPENQTLLRNNGDGTFTDVSEAAGIAKCPGKGMGVVCADYDNDGHTDIFSLNDVWGNFCFHNDGTGKFEEGALLNGFKYNSEGMALGSMGVDCGDFDNDGRLDFYQTSYQGELPVLFRNLGHGSFEDATLRTGAGQGTFHCVKWGCGFVDFDNDGHRDLFIAMGHLQDRVDEYDKTTSFRARNVLLRNRGDGTFEDVSDRCGDGLRPVLSSRGAVFEDFDNDGDMDIVVLNTRDRPTVIRNMLNEMGSTNHWLQIRLEGVKTNRDGVGAHVKVLAGDLAQLDEVHSGRGYQSHWGSRLHFGLGQHDRVGRIEVRWIGGGVDVLENVPVDRLMTIREGGAARSGG
jgi:hypothetical protein